MTFGVESILNFIVQNGGSSPQRKSKWKFGNTSVKVASFVKKKARECHPHISCNDPTDLAQDGSWRWAIDKPSIPQPTPGWERKVKIRSFGSTKYADVYCEAPTKEQPRSLVDVHNYLDAHPREVEEGVNMLQFSFETPVLEGIM